MTRGRLLSLYDAAPDFKPFINYCSIVSHHSFFRLLAGAENQTWYSQPLIILWLLAQGKKKKKENEKPHPNTTLGHTPSQTHPRIHTAIIASGVEDVACTETHSCLTSAVTLLPTLEHCLFLSSSNKLSAGLRHECFLQFKLLFSPSASGDDWQRPLQKICNSQIILCIDISFDSHRKYYA